MAGKYGPNLDPFADQPESEVIKHFFPTFDVAAYTAAQLVTRAERRLMFADARDVKLTEHQEGELDKVNRALRDGAPEVRLAGAAGTGKSTSLSSWTGAWGKPVTFVAPTWRAAGRLSERTGQPATTLHSLVYSGADEDPDTGELVFRTKEGKQLDCATPIVIDEASMVGIGVYSAMRHILPPNAQVFATGDDGQLPPVNEMPAFALDRPHARLDEVHRQADDSGTLGLATEIRRTKSMINTEMAMRHDVKVHRISARTIGKYIAEFYQGNALRPEVVAVMYHTTRGIINDAARAALGFPGMVFGPQVGEVVLATGTKRDGVHIANGDIGRVLDIVAGPRVAGIQTLRVLVDFGKLLPGYVIVIPAAWSAPPKQRGQIPKETRVGMLRAANTDPDAAHVIARLLDLTPGYAMTAHSMQGAEWTRGFVMAERPFKFDGDSWRMPYTQITRFKHAAITVLT